MRAYLLFKTLNMYSSV